MTFWDILAVAGLNALSYSVFLYIVAIAKKDRGVCKILSWVFALGGIPFGAIYETIRQHFAKQHSDQVARLRFVAAATSKPHPTDIWRYHLECDPFDDANGNFDLDAWKQHELNR